MDGQSLYAELEKTGRYASRNKPSSDVCFLNMSTAGVPLSITSNEFDFMSQFVQRHNLKRGYEVATGTGLSAVAAGLGMKDVGGKLVTMDAYIEEAHGLDYYSNGYKELNTDSDGMKSINFLIKKFELDDVVFPKLGWSPDDTEKSIREVFNDDPLDYVFIDALHKDSNLIADIDAVVPFLGDRFVVFIHDTHCFTKDTQSYLSDLLGGKPWALPPECGADTGFNLGYFEKNIL